MTSNNNSTDDGSLSFLNIQPDEANKHFNCPETTQQKLINLQFWLIDFIEDVKTKFGANHIKICTACHNYGSCYLRYHAL